MNDNIIRIYDTWRKKYLIISIGEISEIAEPSDDCTDYWIIMKNRNYYTVDQSTFEELMQTLGFSAND